MLSVLHGYHSRSIDFILAFRQAELKEDVFMEIPAGFSNGELKKQYVLKPDKILYGRENAAFNWFQMLHDGLTNKNLSFKASEIDSFVFYRKDCIILTYVDDCIILPRILKLLTKWLNIFKGILMSNWRSH